MISMTTIYATCRTVRSISQKYIYSRFSIWLWCTVLVSPAIFLDSPLAGASLSTYLDLLYTQTMLRIPCQSQLRAASDSPIFQLEDVFISLFGVYHDKKSIHITTSLGFSLKPYSLACLVCITHIIQIPISVEPTI
jgi:hypothetical protein